MTCSQARSVEVPLAPFGLELLEPKECHVAILGPADRLDGGRIALRSFNDTSARLLIRCTMVCGQIDVSASREA